MNIFLNDEVIHVEDNTTLFSLLETKEFTSKKGIAVAVNNNVVSKNEWDKKQLNENDKVLVISATKGG